MSFLRDRQFPINRAGLNLVSRYAKSLNSSELKQINRLLGKIPAPGNYSSVNRLKGISQENINRLQARLLYKSESRLLITTYMDLTTGLGYLVVKFLPLMLHAIDARIDSTPMTEDNPDLAAGIYALISVYAKLVLLNQRLIAERLRRVASKNSSGLEPDEESQG
jgi:hypothetical protein